MAIGAIDTYRLVSVLIDEGAIVGVHAVKIGHESGHRSEPEARSRHRPDQRPGDLEVFRSVDLDRFGERDRLDLDPTEEPVAGTTETSARHHVERTGLVPIGDAILPTGT